MQQEQDIVLIFMATTKTAKKGFNEESLRLNEALDKITLQEKSLKNFFVKKGYTKIVNLFSQSK